MDYKQYADPDCPMCNGTGYATAPHTDESLHCECTLKNIEDKTSDEADERIKDQ